MVGRDKDSAVAGRCAAVLTATPLPSDWPRSTIPPLPCADSQSNAARPSVSSPARLASPSIPDSRDTKSPAGRCPARQAPPPGTHSSRAQSALPGKNSSRRLVRALAGMESAASVSPSGVGNRDRLAPSRGRRRRGASAGKRMERCEKYIDRDESRIGASATIRNVSAALPKALLRFAAAQISSTSASANSARSWMKRKRASGLVPISASTEALVPSGSASSHLDPQQRALPRVHRGFLELRGHHLAQALEAADLDLAAAGELGLQQFVLVGVVARIERPCRPGVMR